MSDIDKIKEQILFEAESVHPKKTTDAGYIDGLHRALDIIDAHREQRKPRGEWVHECGTDLYSDLWVLKKSPNLLVDIQITSQGMFKAKMWLKSGDPKCYSDIGEFDTLKAAKLAAEDAMEKMEGER